LLPILYEDFLTPSSGLMTYALINGLIFITMKISRGYLTPPDFDSAEYWTYNPSGGRMPWFVRAVKNNGRFWDNQELEEGKERDADVSVNDEQSDHRRQDSIADLRPNVESMGGRESRSQRDRDIKSADIGLRELAISR
jgi:hypothetical protein